MSFKKITLNILDDGPIKVNQDPSLKIRFLGEPIELPEGKDVYLCRCGRSENAPYCDGTHGKTEWKADVARAADKEIKVWEGKTIRTFFNPNACMHVYTCKPLNALREAELAGDANAADEIARVVMSCPSGALSYESKSAAKPIVAERPDINIIEGGEIRLQSAFDINVDLQERQDAVRATLCRCGLSKNKPWCDGRHRTRNGFR